MNVAMTRPEAVLFESFLRASRNYLEFGSGGSTVMASQNVKERIVSVNSSREWLDKVAAAVTNLPGKKPELILRHVDIGPTKEWGYPTSAEARSRWPAYS